MDRDVYVQLIEVEVIPQEYWTLTIVLVVVAIAGAVAAVVLFWLYKRWKLGLPGRPAPSKWTGCDPWPALIHDRGNRAPIIPLYILTGEIV
ncbi:MAG: hypothetical protein JW839_08005 [Candidatus Lokiarchaeota archaeon]|nr:hypothetical protein [Candidatus Lokiarchaeota archaeon]